MCVEGSGQGEGRRARGVCCRSGSSVVRGRAFVWRRGLNGGQRRSGRRVDGSWEWVRDDACHGRQVVQSKVGRPASSHDGGGGTCEAIASGRRSMGRGTDQTWEQVEYLMASGQCTSPRQFRRREATEAASPSAGATQSKMAITAEQKELGQEGN